MKLYMNKRSPFLRKVLKDQQFDDYGWSWFGWIDGHLKAVGDYYGSNLVFQSSTVSLDDQKCVIYLSEKGNTKLYLEGHVNEIYKISAIEEAWAKNIGSTVTNADFGCLGEACEWYEFVADGKTLSIETFFSKDYSESYGDDYPFMKDVSVVGQALLTIKRLSDVKATNPPKKRFSKKESDYMRKILKLAKSDDSTNWNHAVLLAKSLELDGNLFEQLRKEAFSNIKKSGIIIKKIRNH